MTTRHSKCHEQKLAWGALRDQRGRTYSASDWETGKGGLTGDARSCCRQSAKSDRQSGQKGEQVPKSGEVFGGLASSSVGPERVWGAGGGRGG